MTLAAIAGVWLGAACLAALLLGMVFRGARNGDSGPPAGTGYDGRLPWPRESHEQATAVRR